MDIIGVSKFFVVLIVSLRRASSLSFSFRTNPAVRASVYLVFFKFVRKIEFGHTRRNVAGIFNCNWCDYVHSISISECE